MVTYGHSSAWATLLRRATVAQVRDPLTRSDRADSSAVWLDDHGVPERYDAAGALGDAGIDAAWLEDVSPRVPLDALGAVVARSLMATATATALLDHVERSKTRISELIAAGTS
jgi:hypothetical protein